MADFAQAVKWMQEGKLAFRESFEYLEYALEECVHQRGGGRKHKFRALVMRHMPDQEWEDPILIEPDLTSDDWQCKSRRKPRKGKS
jgi:hypothetical protein